MDKKEDRYNDTFPTILRALMENHPMTGTKCTQKELGEFLNIRPQTVSLYMKGETQPTQETLCKMATYFDVSLDYLLTGVSSKNLNLNEELGLSEAAIKKIELIHDFGIGETDEDVIPLLNQLLADTDFYNVLLKIKIGREKIEEANDDPEIRDFQLWNVEKTFAKYVEKLMKK